MWLFSEHGYLSIVEYSPHTPLPKNRKSARKLFNAEEKALGKSYKPATKQSLGSHLLVRARVGEDMDPLLRRAGVERFEDLTADYQYRAIVPREIVSQYVADLTSDINYDSHVKETISGRAPKLKVGSRYSGLMKIWSATADWQPNPPYGGGRWSSWTPSKSTRSISDQLSQEIPDRSGSFKAVDPLTPVSKLYESNGSWFEDSSWLADDADTSSEDRRLDNEYLATLIVDALVENYGAERLQDIPEEGVVAAIQDVLSDSVLIGEER